MEKSKRDAVEKSKRDVTRRDYLVPAVLTLLGYLFTWIIGLILNIYFLYDANRYKEKSGEQPKNRGCLLVLLALNVLIPILLVIIAITVAEIGFELLDIID